jgi:hypothetical protein
MNRILVILVCLSLGIGCSTAQKERREARDRIANQAGFLCDFVNESDFKDIEIELNLRMANKCNSAKPFSVSGYKRLNESSGFMYCCSFKDGANSSAVENRKANNPATSQEPAVEAKVKDSAASGKE